MVSTSQNTNPLGAVVVGDWANPGIITGVAQTVLSGGDLVQVFSGTEGLVGSNRASYTTSDIIFQKAANSSLFNGIVTQNAGSNTFCSVATKGLYLMRCGGVVSGGALLGHNASGNVKNWFPASGTAVLTENIIGRAFTANASGTNNFALVDLK